MLLVLGRGCRGAERRRWMLVFGEMIQCAVILGEFQVPGSNSIVVK